MWKICSAQIAFAASSAETKTFVAAEKLLDTKLYGLAETGFAKFVEQHPDSTNKVAAVLHQAQARFFQTNYDGTLELLQKGFPVSGMLADEYQFWIGQTFFGKQNFQAAADAFSAVAKNFPGSSRQLEACYLEALAESKLDHWPRVIVLLQTPTGKFQVAAKTQPDSAFFVEGNLLLAEALWKENRFAEAEKVITQLDGRNLTPEAKWRQIFLLCRVQMAAGVAENALRTSTNLLAAARETGNRGNYAASILLRGEILAKLGRMPEAIQAYEQNLSEGSVTNVPSEMRRQSFFKTIDLLLAQKETTNAMRRLENFIEKNPADEALDLAKITLGELSLKQFVATTAGTNRVLVATNLFEQALTNFSAVVTNFPQSQHLGKAYLDRGWCLWIQENISAAESDFEEATKRLPASEDQAVARFKLADTQFRQTNYAAAVTNYQLLIERHARLERVTNSLFEPALFQMARASLKIGNDAAATNAMRKLLDWFPNGSLGERGVLLVGQTFTRAGNPGEARELFINFLSRFPGSPLVPEIKLAIAQTYVQEEKWPAALAEYDEWAKNFAEHPLLAQGEFSRALAYDRAKMQTNAFILFTNFVARFPSNQLAALAQNWVADFYWNHEDFRNAEKSYQELYQKFNSSPDLGYRARLMAGRAAYDRSDYKEAAKYFSDLITLLDQNTNSPPGLTDEALFALGDTYFQDFLSNTNEATMRDAIQALTRITKSSTNTIGLLATGRIGDYYFQWAGLDSAQAEASYNKALDYYGDVLKSEVADVSARSRTEVCVGNICVKVAELKSGADKKAWADAALNHYMTVVNESNLRDGETFDPKWTYEAGIAAAKICEGSGNWESAKKIYQRLAAALPVLRLACEKKIAACEIHLETAKN